MPSGLGDDSGVMNRQDHQGAVPNRGAGASIRVFLVDDHPIYAQVMAEVLAQAGGFAVVGTAPDAETALARLRDLPVDLLLLDLVLPGMGGLELLSAIREIPGVGRVVVYSGLATDESIAVAFSLGVSAFVEKSSPVDEVIATLRAVGRGESPLSARMSGVLRTLVRQRSARKDLSPSDLAVLSRLARMQSPKEIAGDLGMSQSAIYKARDRIGARAGFGARPDFRAIAAGLGLIAPASPRTASRGGGVEGSA